MQEELKEVRAELAIIASNVDLLVEYAKSLEAENQALRIQHALLKQEYDLEVAKPWYKKLV